MSEPRYIPHFIFSTLPVTQEITCFYCVESINPIEHEEYFVASIPSGGQALHFHIACFEEFAWMMFTYYHTYVHKEKVAIVN